MRIRGMTYMQRSELLHVPLYLAPQSVVPLY